jgi:hypothetical protein
MVKEKFSKEHCLEDLEDLEDIEISKGELTFDKTSFVESKKVICFLCIKLLNQEYFKIRTVSFHGGELGT